MTPQKQTSFIEKVYNSRLGLEGMQIVVYSDRARMDEQDIVDAQYDFTDIGDKMMNEINGERIKKNYNINEGEELGKRLHEERVNWIKNVGCRRPRRPETTNVGVGALGNPKEQWSMQIFKAQTKKAPLLKGAVIEDDWSSLKSYTKTNYLIVTTVTPISPSPYVPILKSFTCG